MGRAENRLVAWVSKGAAIALVAAALGCWAIAAAAQSDEPLPSWNDGAAKQAILEFVEAVTTEGGADYVAPAEREYIYGPANSLPDTRIGTFSQELMDEAKQKGWVVISMKNDWNTIFPWAAK